MVLPSLTNIQASSILWPLVMIQLMVRCLVVRLGLSLMMPGRYIYDHNDVCNASCFSVWTGVDLALVIECI